MDRSPDGHLEILVVASLAWRIEQAAISALSSMSDRALRHIVPHSLGNSAVNSAAGQLTHIPAG
jgi:hypothetical protein